MKKKMLMLLCAALGGVILSVGGCKKKEEGKSTTPTPGQEYTETKNPVNTIKPENTPVIPGNTSKKAEFSFLEEKEEKKAGEVMYFESGIFYPVFTSGDGTEELNGFVNRILEEYREFLSEAAVGAEENYEAWKEDSYGDVYLPEAEELKISAEWQDENRLTLRLQYYSNTGGVHPNVFERAFVVEKKTGKQLTIQELSESYGLLPEELAQYASEVFFEKGGDGLYVTEENGELQDAVLQFFELNQWYLSQEGLCIFANPYDIAPYAYGTISCEISYQCLEQGLKK